MAGSLLNNTDRSYLSIHNIYVVKFYNLIGCTPVDDITQIPTKSLQVIIRMEWCEIVKPFLIDDLMNNRGGRESLSLKYYVTTSFVWRVGVKLGKYKST